ncbi:hypothetical protein N7532_008219, partial [Penicillium argentinense]
KEDFSFRGPVGLCLRQAPNTAKELFFGRESELNDMKPHFDEQNAPCLVLGGIGGVGKSRLAIAYAESTASTGLPVLSSESKIPESLMVNILLNVQFDISDYYPVTSSGAIIVTTRQPECIPGKIRIIHIGAFQNIEDSLLVLQTRSERQNVQSDTTDKGAKRLANRLKGFPLALATAGTYLKRSTFSFQRYLEEYEKRWNIDPRHPPELPEYRERTLYTTWDLSYAFLEEKEPRAAKLLKLLAYFDNRNLWFEFFHGGLTEKSPEWLRETVTGEVSFQGEMKSIQHRTHGACITVHDWTMAALNKNINMEYYYYALDCVDATISENDDTSGASLMNITYSRPAGYAARLAHHWFLESDAIDGITLNLYDQYEKLSKASHLLKQQVQFAAAS